MEVEGLPEWCNIIYLGSIFASPAAAFLDTAMDGSPPVGYFTACTV